MVTAGVHLLIDTMARRRYPVVIYDSSPAPVGTREAEK